MRKTTKLMIACAAAATTIVAACADVGRPIAPDLQPGSRRSVGESSDLLGGLLGGLTSLLVAPVTRTTPLASDVSWSFTAGPAGAVSSNSSVGLTISIPSGALSSTQTITVIALAGAPVAYRFEPHLVFNKKVTLTQSLTGTSAGGLFPLFVKGAHFAGDTLALDPSGLAIVDEIVAALVNPLTNTASFKVKHFSGWSLASGSVGDGDE